MDNQVSEQAASAGDVQASAMEGHTSVDFVPTSEPAQVPQPDDSQSTATDNKESKDWRKSQSEWQDMAEKAKKGETAAQTLDRLKSALGLEEQKEAKDEDVVQTLQRQIQTLQEKASRADWEKHHPIVDSTEYREAWQSIIDAKGHLVRSGDLTYDELWSMVPKKTKPSTTDRDLREQELNIGSVPYASKSSAGGEDVDPEVMSLLRRMHPNMSDEQIKKLSA